MMARFFTLLAMVAVFGLAACGREQTGDEVVEYEAEIIGETSPEYLDAVLDAIDEIESMADTTDEVIDEEF